MSSYEHRPHSTTTVLWRHRPATSPRSYNLRRAGRRHVQIIDLVEARSRRSRGTRLRMCHMDGTGRKGSIATDVCNTGINHDDDKLYKAFAGVLSQSSQRAGKAGHREGPGRPGRGMAWPRPRLNNQAAQSCAWARLDRPGPPGLKLITSRKYMPLYRYITYCSISGITHLKSLDRTGPPGLKLITSRKYMPLYRYITY